MRSSGGVAPAAEAARAGRLERALGPRRRRGRRRPAGAALAATATRSGSTWAAPRATSAWSRTAAVRRTDSREIGGRVIQLPMVDVHTVGAGGGSIGWRDARRRAAGRAALGRAPSPGPPATGAAAPSRRSPTPTCCSATCAPDSRARRRASSSTPRRPRGAVGAARPTSSGSSELETAEGIVRVANQEMVRALRVVTVERGVDPRGFALMPFGGAGPMHAAAIADELGIERILCPRASGVLSALGLIASERRRDTARTVLLARRRADRRADRRRGRATLRESLADGTRRRRGRGRLRAALPRPGLRARRSPGRRAPDPGELAERFAAEHERRYGYRDPDAEVELVNDPRSALVEPGPDAAPARRRRRASSSAATRRARFGGEWHRGRGPARRARGGHRGRRARACSSCPRRPWCCRRAGAPRSTTRGRSCAGGGDEPRGSTRSRSRCWSAPCAPPATRWARC